MFDVEDLVYKDPSNGLLFGTPPDGNVYPKVTIGKNMKTDGRYLLTGDTRTVNVEPKHVLQLVRKLANRLRGVAPDSDRRTIVTDAASLMQIGRRCSIPVEKLTLLLEGLEAQI